MCKCIQYLCPLTNTTFSTGLSGLEEQCTLYAPPPFCGAALLGTLTLPHGLAELHITGWGLKVDFKSQ